MDAMGNDSSLYEQLFNIGCSSHVVVPSHIPAIHLGEFLCSMLRNHNPKKLVLEGTII